MVNQPKGKYALRLLNQLGQQVYRNVLNHLGGSASETIAIPAKVSKGLYHLHISGIEATTMMDVVIEAP